MSRAFNRNQILLLQTVSNNSTETITSIIRRLSRTSNISESTLKVNSRILRNLNLITFGDSSIAELTAFGKAVIRILGGG